MSFYDDASLVFLPSGEAGKDGKAYSMKPTNGNGDFTFSRGSNLTATRVDSNGLIEKGRENLLLQSNQFNTTWTTSNASVTSGQSGYDGSSDAWEIARNGGSGLAFINQVISNNGVHTFSIYAKANTEDWIYLQDTSTGGGGGYFDLANGTAGTTSGIDSSIDSVGGGWYRIQVVSNRTTSGNIRIFVASANANLTVTGSIYIQDAQLEIGLVATEYIESGATTGLAGLLEDSPRFDYSGGASCPSLLLEPSRTNLLNQSEYLGGEFALDNVSLDYNYGVSPEGVSNSALLTQTGSSSSNSMYEFNLPTTDGSYTYSFFFKAGTSTSCRMYVGTGIAEDFNPQTITAGYSGGTLNILFEDYGNGWWRASATQTLSGASTNRFSIYPDRGNQGRNIEIWGFQAEAASYPTSYIPNHSGGSVTRNADVNTLLNQSGVIGQTAGTILFDAYFDEADKINLSISDSTSNNNILIDTTSGKQVFAVVQQGGSTQAAISTSGSFFTEGDRLKCAIAYDDRDMAFYINGTQVGTAAPNLIPACDDIKFSRWNGALAANQRVNRVVLFTTRLSNANLVTLTS